MNETLNAHNKYILNIMDFEPIFLKLPPEEIVTIKDILEGYEGLAILRTVNPSRGEIVIIALPDTVETVKDLLNSLLAQIPFSYVDAPYAISDDWLLADHL